MFTCVRTVMLNIYRFYLIFSLFDCFVFNSVIFFIESSYITNIVIILRILT